MMMNIYEEYLNLEIDTSFIGLEKGADVDEDNGYFCTPIGAKIIGWEGCGGIHYCFIDGFLDTIFAVNPESCDDKCVYPLAENFKIFLQLVLAGKSVTAIEQIAYWDKETFIDFLNSEDNAVMEEQEEVLSMIKEKLQITPFDDVYEYVKQLQQEFDYSKLAFSDEYYDVLGIER